MLRIIVELTLEIDGEQCICFRDCQKLFDRVNWTKLMQILKISGINWRERKLINKLYAWIRELKCDWTEGRQEVCKLEEELNKDAVFHQCCSNCTANSLPRKLWMGFKISRSEGKLFKL
jgi:hypothetical protein